MENIESLFELSNKIVSMYNDFLFNSVYSSDSRRRENMLKQIKNLVIREYNFVRVLSFAEIERYYNGEYSLDEDYQSIVFDRVNAKMMNLTDDYDKYILTGRELGIMGIPEDMHLSIFDVVMSMLELDAYRRLTERINSSSTNDCQDEWFVSQLKEKLNVLSLESFYMMSTSEILALLSDGDIDNIPRISRSVIEEKLRSLNKGYLPRDIDEIVDTYAKSALTRAALVTKLDNKPAAVFNYLVSYVRLEVVIDSYFQKDKLLAFGNYCDSICNSSNQASIGMVKQLIKRRLDSEKK